ncbi:MAG: NUDIX hydrolase [Panacagrimonas sp.]
MSSSNSSVPTPVRLAATVLLLRDGADGADGIEVFMVVRHQEIDFASGALVFPGGKLAADDTDPRIRMRCTGVDDLSSDQIALRVGAIREAFEECGVLLARASGDSALVGPARLAEIGARYRKPLDRGEIGIAEMLDTENLILACEELVPFAHWITPTFMPKRFDTYFYLAVAPPEQIALHDGREMVDSVWLSPADALTQAEAGNRTIVPATLINIRKLGFSSNVGAALSAARAEPVVTVLPEVVERPGGKMLRIPAEAGYRITEFAAPTLLK